jgi:D-alanyl-D-alanine carboxypeptidase
LDRAANLALATGGSAIVVHAQWPRGSWDQGYGLKTLDAATPARPEDVVLPGTLLDTWLAVAALRLVEEGRLSLDEPLDQRLGALGLAVPRPVTLRELLGQTSEIPDLPRDPRPPAGALDAPLTPKDVVRRIAGQPWDTSGLAPFSLTATAPAVVALLVESLSGKPLRDVLDDDILRPLHLAGTTLGSIPSDRLLHGYGWLDGQRVDLAGRELVRFVTGGATTTAQDMATFLSALLGGRLLKPSSVDAMKTVGLAPYGLGLWRAQDGCSLDGWLYGQRADTLGYSSVVLGTADGTRTVAIAATSPVEDLNAAGPDNEKSLYSAQLWSAAKEFLDRTCVLG